MIRIRCFGPFAAWDSVGEPVAFPARSAAELAAFTAFRKTMRSDRIEAARALWPDHDLRDARTNLRKALQRARSVLPVLQASEDQIWISPQDAECDARGFEQLHNAYVSQSQTPDGLNALRAEWEMVRRPLMEGWDSEWIEPFRIRFRFYADEIGAELAEGLEESGDPEQAASVWRSILADSPSQVQALENVLRLEAVQGGSERALELLNSLDPSALPDDESMPKSLMRVIKAIRANSTPQTVRPEHFRSKTQMRLLARLLESNLERGGEEALRLLQSELQSSIAIDNPRVFLSLLHGSLLAYGRYTDLSGSLATSAGIWASWCSEFDVGHYWADWVIAQAPSDSASRARALGCKGFMCMEQRRWEEARRLLVEGKELAERIGDTPVALRITSQLSGFYWHYGDTKRAMEGYMGVFERASEAEDAQDSQLAAASNLAYLHGVLGDWREVLFWSDKTMELVSHGIIATFLLIPHGLALVKTGDSKAGIAKLLTALGTTSEQGMKRFNQLALEASAMALHHLGGTEAAAQILDGAECHRRSISHDRGVCEKEMVRRETGFTHWDREVPNPWRTQPLQSLNSFAAERLQAYL